MTPPIGVSMRICSSGSESRQILSGAVFAASFLFTRKAGYLGPSFRLSPTQCAPNMFRVLGSIEALNERMNLNLTHHDINWVYNLQHLKNQGYYLKSRQAEVRMIQCLPQSNKGLKEDFLIFSGQWHDGLPCPVKEGEPGGGPNYLIYVLNCLDSSFPVIVGLH